MASTLEEEQQYPCMTPLDELDWISAPKPGGAAGGTVSPKKAVLTPGPKTKVIPIVKVKAKPGESKGSKKGKGKGKGEGKLRKKKRKKGAGKGARKDSTDGAGARQVSA